MVRVAPKFIPTVKFKPRRFIHKTKLCIWKNIMSILAKDCYVINVLDKSI